MTWECPDGSGGVQGPFKGGEKQRRAERCRVRRAQLSLQL